MIGFVYEADQEAIKEAQDRVDELRHNEMLDKIDEAIEAIEDNKKNDNIYDFQGSDVIKDITTEDALKLYNLIHDSTDLDTLLADKMFTDLKNANSTNNSSVSIQIGDIRVEGVQDANGLAQSIISELPNKLIQALYK